ncbi:DinB family protein [Streptomyces sp. NPDC005374]|uniref:DinB family protein n=1 Tax=Streptomyces sp. NPDC005374 TaxID=3364713 RepID=UPI00367D463C
MSERGTELMSKALAQLDEARGLLAEAHDSDLHRPYVDREGDHSANSVGNAALHFVEGYQKIGRLLKGAGYVSASLTGETVQGNGHRHDHDHEAEITDVLKGLDAAKVRLTLLADLTDAQLDSIPPMKNQWADGERTLLTVLDVIIAHQAGHLASLGDALG